MLTYLIQHGTWDGLVSGRWVALVQCSGRGRSVPSVHLQGFSLHCLYPLHNHDITNGMKSLYKLTECLCQHLVNHCSVIVSQSLVVSILYLWVIITSCIHWACSVSNGTSCIHTEHAHYMYQNGHHTIKLSIKMVQHIIHWACSVPRGTKRVESTLISVTQHPGR